MPKKLKNFSWQIHKGAGTLKKTQTLPKKCIAHNKIIWKV